MKSKGRSYKFWLHPADGKHAACIAKLDSLLDTIKVGENARRGDFSREMATALHKHFFGKKSVSVSTQRNLPVSSSPAISKRHSNSNDPTKRGWWFLTSTDWGSQKTRPQSQTVM